MTIIILGNFFAFMVICCIATFKGLDLKKKSSWWFGLYGFISGFLLGFLRADDNGDYYIVANLTASLQAGAAFTFVILFGGATNRWNRRWAEKYLEHTEIPVEEQYDKLAESLFNERKSHKSK